MSHIAVQVRKESGTIEISPGHARRAQLQGAALSIRNAREFRALLEELFRAASVP